MKYITAICLLVLSGCNNVSTTYTRPNIPVPQLQPVQQLPVEWTIITRENAQNRLQEIEQRDGALTLFATSPQGYQNLSINVAELRRYIIQQQAVITALRQYYENNQEQSNETNRQ